MKISPVLNRILPPLYRPRYSNYFRVTGRRPRNDLIVAITRLYHREQYYGRATVSLLIRDIIHARGV